MHPASRKNCRKMKTIRTGVRTLARTREIFFRLIRSHVISAATTLHGEWLNDIEQAGADVSSDLDWVVDYFQEGNIRDGKYVLEECLGCEAFKYLQEATQGNPEGSASSRPSPERRRTAVGQFLEKLWQLSEYEKAAAGLVQAMIKAGSLVREENIVGSVRVLQEFQETPSYRFICGLN